VNDDCWRAGGWPHGTNNQGELMAVLDLFRATSHLPDEDLHILCDSQYVINSVTKWMPGWKRKGWRKSDGKPVLNVDILKDIDKELKGRKYTFEWVRGHAGHDLNEAADDRARAAATAYQQGVAVRSGPGFTAGAVAATASAPAASVAPAGARRPAEEAAGHGVQQRSGQQELFADGRYSEPDLFSELDTELFAAATAGEASPEEIVVGLERELLRPDVRADIGRTGVLLHPEFTEIGSSGRMWNRDAVMMALEENPAPATEIEVLGTDRIGTGAVLLTYRTQGYKGADLRSSLWVLDGAQWRLRFHQGTPEA
jgi:ribonuclease HI